MNQQTLQSIGLRRLAVLFIVAIFITLFVSNGAWADALFQSPVSPIVEEVEPFQPEPFAPEEPIDEQFQSEPLPEEPAPFESAPVEEPLEPATEFQSPIIPNEPIDGAPAASQPAVPEPRSVRSPRDDAGESQGSPNFILDQAELIDTVVVSTAYVWLCCGIGLFLLIPLVFLFLQIRGRTKIIKEEIY
ncbi:MAG: hypothetical protein KDI79_25000 [Anaerolineae bacterium]|nr:hypothetical protein [Anaerolineae bacterium]